MRKFRVLVEIDELELEKFAEENNGISETVPDEGLTVREILNRYASGTLTPVAQEPFYSEDLPDLRGMDISQLYEMKREAQLDIEEIQAEIKRQEETIDVPAEVIPTNDQNVEP